MDFIHLSIAFVEKIAFTWVDSFSDALGRDTFGDTLGRATFGERHH
ncbi:hypothetical protein [Calothrix sp. 336/3]|nr:hypothetical protein [Calothrix sp. 336/3]